jgi:hypothetical protein
VNVVPFENEQAAYDEAMEHLNRALDAMRYANRPPDPPFGPDGLAAPAERRYQGSPLRSRELSLAITEAETAALWLRQDADTKALNTYA